MPIFIKTESKSTAGRLFHTAIFIFLILGGATMIYPFLLMVSGAFRSEMDENDLSLVPEFLVEESALYRKFLEFKYQQRIASYNAAHLDRQFAFRTIPTPPGINQAALADFQAFLSEVEIPRHWRILGGVSGSRTVPENLRELRNRLRTQFDGDITLFNRNTGGAAGGWNDITLPAPDWLSTRFDYDDNALWHAYFALMDEAPKAEVQVVSLSGNFLEFIILPRFADVDALNAGFGLDLAMMGDFRIPRTVPPPAQAAFRAEWINYILEDLNVSFVLLEGVPDAAFQDFLAKSYIGNIGELNDVWQSEFSDFGQITLPAGGLLHGGARQDYREFLSETAPEHWVLVGPEFAWVDWLEERYERDLTVLRAAWGEPLQNFRAAWMPFASQELEFVRENLGGLRLQFALRNFISVFDAAFVDGRVFYNTAIFCLISVLAAVLINPLAAYALSRYQLPGTYKILLLMMAVMAFPPMVTTIPTFLMLKSFGMMNTFAALILPTIASGYLIYLLKGFFDSLPKELYEAAQVEGASELRMFFVITMALSKPILAVVALSAFNSAYTMFLFALIVAPDENMWLLSVWLYQYRETVSMGGVFASVLLASIPPLLVFLFAQNIILRGIVVPVEK
jgi:ABC-type glycerol-3-phosphate transport system permease component